MTYSIWGAQGLLIRPTKHFTTEIHDFDFDLWLASQTASKSRQGEKNKHA